MYNWFANHNFNKSIYIYGVQYTCHLLRLSEFSGTASGCNNHPNQKRQAQDVVARLLNEFLQISG
jgi:hypothetical protein